MEEVNKDAELRALMGQIKYLEAEVEALIALLRTTMKWTDQCPFCETEFPKHIDTHDTQCKFRVAVEGFKE
jgi:hypothetical protein